MVVRPTLEHGTAVRVAAAEYQRVIGTLRLLSEQDWGRPTDCCQARCAPVSRSPR